MNQNHFNVIVVGAGISGISAGYHLQKRCPDQSFAILESRNTIGGTWICFVIRVSGQTPTCRLWVFGSNHGRE